MNTPRPLSAAAVLAVLAIVTAPPAHAAGLRAPSEAFWDSTGHMVVARIAWNHMTPLARQRAVDVLRRGPATAHVCALAATGSPTESAQRDCFVRAATWPDRMRGTPRHRETWHFLDTYFRPGPNGQPVELNIPRPAVNAISRLQQMKDSVNRTQVRDTTRAMQLAWIEHLVGDIHQPLHTTSRVTLQHPFPPEGDRGGNFFELSGHPDNLHSWWDQTITRQFRRTTSEQSNTPAFLTRVATTLEGMPGTAVTIPDPFDFESWFQEGVRSARTDVYTGIQEHTVPDTDYRARTSRVADPAVVRAGLRLAALMNRLFDPPSH